jgi:hypothetical protein
MLDVPLRDIVMLSWEEASTQNTCKNLGQAMNPVLWMTVRRHWPVRHFFYKLETDLSLSNSSHSPEETRVSWQQSAIRTRNKDPPKFIKDILPTSKEWTRLWFLRHRVLHPPFSNIGGEVIDIIVVAANLCTIYC